MALARSVYPAAFRQPGDSALASNLGFCRPLPRPPWKIHKFLGSKTGIRFDTKWHHNWPNQLFSARISIKISVRVFFGFSVFVFVWKICSKNMLVRYRGKNNEGVLERPGTKWKVLRAISSTLKCQFTGKCRKVDFSMPCKTKSAEKLHVWPYARCGHPGNPQTSPISTWIAKKTIFVKK